MGDKLGSRRTMKQAGVPVVPGTAEGVSDVDAAVLAAKEIGYPLMLKASAGGGGIGMVLCESEQALTQQFDSVKNRAKAYFGDDIVYVEKFEEVFNWRSQKKERKYLDKYFNTFLVDN